jgi:cation:H+ antiporter
MIGVSILLIIFLSDGKINKIEGMILFSLLLIYTVFNILLSLKESKEIKNEFESELKTRLKVSTAILFFIVGLALLIFGADLFLKGAIALAKIFNISDVVIGLTIVAVGTSLPELFTSVVASIKKESDIAVGNVVGSNIFNILSILGFTAIISPVSSAGISQVDLTIMLAAALVLLPLSYTNFKISRAEGLFLIIGYISYIIFLLQS